MDKDEILAKSRAENKNQDVYEKEVLKQANVYAMIVLLVIATVFVVVQIVTGGGLNYGLYALVFSGNMTVSWVKFWKLKQKTVLPLAIMHTLLVLALSGCHIYQLIASSTIL